MCLARFLLFNCIFQDSRDICSVFSAFFKALASFSARKSHGLRAALSPEPAEFCNLGAGNLGVVEERGAVPGA